MDDDATINLCTNEKSLNPLRRDLNSADAVEDPDDQLNILQRQADVVWSELLWTKYCHQDGKIFDYIMLSVPGDFLKDFDMFIYLSH